MAASMAWRNRLKNHKIFQDLARNNDTYPNSVDSQNLVVIKDGEIYVWNADTASVLTTNLKSLIRKNETESESRVPYQTLLCHNAPRYDVESLAFNETGTLLALVGKAGVTVLEMPQRWGKYAEYEGGKPKIICKSIPVAERFFLRDRGRALQASWHPGSATDTHIALLNVDNTIRLYSIEDPQTPVASYPLQGDAPRGPSSSLSLSTTTTRTSSRLLQVEAALGESGVAFDFGLPVELELKNKAVGAAATGREEAKAMAWPMYVLMGNGDVYLQMTAINSSFTAPLQGPLHMYPPAEDNYGTDACSILCLACRPGAVVIATAEGRLYHGVLLPNKKQQQQQQQKKDDTQLNSSTAGETSPCIFMQPPEPSMYVYESVELELSLTTLDVRTETTVTEDDFSCPIRLQKDHACADRYHCCHSAGVHTVALPWLNSLDYFCKDNVEDDEGLRFLEDSDHAIIEHVICTKPLPSSPPSPILGLTMTADRLLGSTLVCLTATNQCLILPLLQHYRQQAPPLLSESESRTSSRSPLRQLYSEPFDSHIRKLLQRNTSSPLLMMGSTSRTEVSPRECFQLLTRATQVFREEYVQKQEMAGQQIQRRIRVLRQQKELQQEDLDTCMAAKNVLCDAAHGLAEKLERSKENQEKLIERIEAVFQKLQSRLPVSEAESNMKKELLEIEEKINTYKANIKQMNLKMEYQDKQIKQHEKRGRRGKLELNEKQSEKLKEALKQEGTDIGDLVKQISHLKVSLDV